MEDDSTSIIHKLQLLSQAVYIDTNKNFYDSDDCGELDGHICILFRKKFSRNNFCCWFYKSKVSIK